MNENPLDFLKDLDTGVRASGECRSDNNVSMVGAATRAKIEEVFSRQHRVAARMRHLQGPMLAGDLSANRAAGNPSNR